jgi:hypothetical protein
VSPNFFSSNSEANFLAVPRFPVSFVASLSYCQQPTCPSVKLLPSLQYLSISQPVRQAHLPISQSVRQPTCQSGNLSASLPIPQ